jgi:hypothetical protein
MYRQSDAPGGDRCWNKSGTPELVGDCVEVFTEVSQDHPELVVSFGPLLTGLIEHKNTRVRWEAVHALAHITTCVPEVIRPILSLIAQLIEQDTSVIVRDHAVDILSNFAATSPRLPGWSTRIYLLRRPYGRAIMLHMRCLGWIKPQGNGQTYGKKSRRQWNLY